MRRATFRRNLGLQNSRLGRKQTPAEVVLRLAVLKHVRNWSFEETEREVRTNVVYRQFTRIGAEKVPDAKTRGRLVQALGPKVLLPQYRNHEGTCAVPETLAGAVRYLIKITSFCASL